MSEFFLFKGREIKKSSSSPSDRGKILVLTSRTIPVAFLFEVAKILETFL